MDGRWVVVACAALMSAALACGAGPTFVCNSSADCGADGVCEANGGCSFPDPDCDSGRRFAPYTPSGSECVPVEAGTGSTSTTGAPTTVDTLDPPTTNASSTTEAPPDTTTGRDSSSTSSDVVPVTSDGTSSSSTGDDESSTGSELFFDVFDDFERPDADDIGNGWVEKTPEGFALIDGGIRRVTTMDSYRENFVYRPLSTWTNAEAIVELEWFDLSTDYGSPQIGLRMQLDDIDVPASVTGYLLFINGGTGDLTITRQLGGTFSQEWETPLASDVEVGPRYRLRIRVFGSDPVGIDGFLEQRVGDDWVLHTEVHGVDNGLDQIATPGTLAVGGHIQTELWTYESVSLESFD